MIQIWDTNILRSLASGELGSPGALKGTDSVAITAPTIVELVTKLSPQNFEVKRAAAQVAVQYQDFILSPPNIIINFLMKKISAREEQHETEKFSGLLLSFSQAEHMPKENIKHLFKTTSGQEIVVEFNLKLWNELRAKTDAAQLSFTKNMVAETFEILKKSFPTKTFGRGLKKREYELLTKFSKMSSVRLAMIRGVVDFDQNFPNMFSSKISLELWREAIMRFKVYCDVYAQYIIGCVGGRTPEENDFGDITLLPYLSGRACLVTTERKWGEFARLAGHEESVRVLKLKRR